MQFVVGEGCGDGRLCVARPCDLRYGGLARRGRFPGLLKTDKDVALALSGWSAYGPADRKPRKSIYKPPRRSQQHSRPVKVSLSAQP